MQDLLAPPLPDLPAARKRQAPKLLLVVTWRVPRITPLRRKLTPQQHLVRAPPVPLLLLLLQRHPQLGMHQHISFSVTVSPSSKQWKHACVSKRHSKT